MILHFQISEGDSILVAAAQVAGIREVSIGLFVYLTSGQQIHVFDNDYNRAAGALWQEYIEGKAK